MLCAMLVALMVAIGGITRLTESGLSIVEWKLVSGTLPPLSQAAWVAEFEAYKQTPQFQQVNRDFCLSDFKGIFWLEYIHRLLGRVIGMVVFVPFVYFAVRRALPRRLVWRGLGISALVGAQGAVGWVMVASGLQDQPRVEPLKLALHLLLAFAVFALLQWTRWQVNATARPSTSPRLALFTRLLLLTATLQIFFGALIAGLRAGLTYNTYPLMDGALVPDGLHRLQPWWLNHLENVVMVQFQHRMLAIGLVIMILTFIFYAWKRLDQRPLLLRLLVVIFLQFGLGVITLLSVVNPWFASAHQLMALLLFSLLVRLIYVTPWQQTPPR